MTGDISLLSINILNIDAVILSEMFSGFKTPSKFVEPKVAFGKMCAAAKKQSTPEILYCSVGTAQLTVLLCNEYGNLMSCGSNPNISEIVIARMTKEKITELSKSNLLPKEYLVRLRGNLEALKTFCGKKNIKYTENVWPGISRFHGFIFGNKAYVAQWVIDSDGCLSADTELRCIDGRKNSTVIYKLKEMFSSNCQKKIDNELIQTT